MHTHRAHEMHLTLNKYERLFCSIVSVQAFACVHFTPVCVSRKRFSRGKTFNSKFSTRSSHRYIHKRLRCYVLWMHKEIIKKRAFTWRALTANERRAEKKALCFIRRHRRHAKIKLLLYRLFEFKFCTVLL